MDICPHCKARLPKDATWCGQCHQPVGGDLSKVLRELEEIPEAQRRGSGWVPPASLTEPPRPKEFSRVKAGPLSFGPVPKIIATVIVLWVILGQALLLARMGDHPASAFVFILLAFSMLGGTGLLLGIWKRERIK